MGGRWLGAESGVPGEVVGEVRVERAVRASCWWVLA